MFHVPNAQTHVYADYDPDALRMVAGYSVAATLRTNCRNTRQIAFSTRAHTGADVGVAAASIGPEVVWKSVATVEDETFLLDAHLRELREADVPPGDVTIVSLRGDWATSSAAALRDGRRGRIRVLDADWAADWPGTTTSWCTTTAIKGLENRFVCVVDLDGLAGHIDHLYVALSRARAGLWVAVDPVAAIRVKDLFREFGPGAAAVLGNVR
jgi:hypothetical protein